MLINGTVLHTVLSNEKHVIFNMILHCALKLNAFSVALPCIDDNVTVIFKKRSICNILNGRVFVIFPLVFFINYQLLVFHFSRNILFI